MQAYDPFCGLPPVPAELAGRWTLEPALLAGLALALALVLATARHRGQGIAAWALAAALFVSPLCALSMALFSARVGQHLALTLVAAPLLAAALPPLRTPPWAPAGTFAALFWLWHAPAPYDLTLRSDLAYWAMHLSLAGAALVLWASVAGARRSRPFAAFLALAFTAAQMTIFAALLVLAPRAWHAWHVEGAALWGLTAASDQALAGALMWVVGAGLMGAAVAALLTGPLLRPGGPGPARHGSAG
jgi:putative membrane protein